MKEEPLVQLLNRLYGSEPWPRPFNLLKARDLVSAGTDPGKAARSVGISKKRLVEFLNSGEPLSLLFGSSPPGEEITRRTQQILGNLIVGRCAEITFEDLYKAHVHTTELELRDLREGRSDTDYRLYNGRGRPVYRINIKFHGSLFRRAKEMVGLEPEDCFPLATYKIYGALQKQREDELPYIFLVVSVPNLTAEQIGATVPAEMLEFIAYVMTNPSIPKKRDMEDRVVMTLERETHAAFAATRQRVASANWYILGAKKADKLLREKLFDRVFALRTRGFARQFGGAELDMHFSLAQDLTPLNTYLDMLRDAGYPRVTTLLERGDY